MAIPSANSTLVIEDYLKYPSQDVVSRISAIMTPEQVYSNSFRSLYDESGAKEALKY
jgi:hypothetical protein